VANSNTTAESISTLQIRGGFLIAINNKDGSFRLVDSYLSPADLAMPFLQPSTFMLVNMPYSRFVLVLK
jgi:hypothetical protein